MREVGDAAGDRVREEVGDGNDLHLKSIYSSFASFPPLPDRKLLCNTNMLHLIHWPIISSVGLLA